MTNSTLDTAIQKTLHQAEADARARMQPVENDEPVAMPLGDAIAELIRRRFGGVTAGPSRRREGER